MISTQAGELSDADTSLRYLTLSRPGAGDRIAATVLLPAAYIRVNKPDTQKQRRRRESNSSGPFPKRATLVIHPEGKDAG